MTDDEIAKVVADIRYPGHEFQLLERGTDLALRVGNGTMWGRKWLLSQFMTRSEIVQTAFLALKTWTEHEMREQFLYKGRAVFGPHISVDEFYEIAGRLDVRHE